MSHRGRVDATVHLAAVAAAMAKPGEPAATYAALETAMDAALGHKLFASLGCASVLNVPVVWDGRVLGTMNLLHEAEWYDDGDATLGLAFAALAVPALR
jgi:hypothetical protein